MKLGPLWLHRLEQWDLECWPILCAHWKRPNVCTRIACLWREGTRLRLFIRGLGFFGAPREGA